MSATQRAGELSPDGTPRIALVFVGPKTPWGWLGLIPLLTGVVGSGPLYTLLGIQTCPQRGGPAS